MRDLSIARDERDLCYTPSDPKGGDRELDDSRFSLDHFPKKLLTITDGFKTQTGQKLAQERHKLCPDF